MRMPTLIHHDRLAPRERRRLAFGWRTLIRHAGTAAVLAGFAAWFVLLRPQFLGGPAAYVMVSGTSMEPTLRSGDFILTRKPESYKIGDIVAYRLPENEVGAGAIVIHRIIRGDSGSGFIIKGDNKRGPDIWRPKPRDLLGTAWIRIPRAGVLLQRLHAPVPLAFFAGMLTFLLIAPWPTFRRSGDK